MAPVNPFEDLPPESDAAAENRLAKMEATLEQVRRERQALRRELGKQKSELEAAQELLGKVTAIRGDAVTKVPKWLGAKKRRSKKPHVTPILLLSDLHFDEVVLPHEVNGQNSYNRSVAEQRLENTVEGCIEYLDMFCTGAEFDGIVCALGGDMISGDIHEELAEGNEGSTAETVVHWTPLMSSAISRLADHFGKVYVPSVSGNHDRNGKKKRYSGRETSSWTWVMSHWIADSFDNDDRVTVDVSPAAELPFEVYENRFLLTHGDQVRFGGGVGGLSVPFNKFALRKQQLYPGAHILAGHFHQLTFANSWTVNGSLKGLDPFALAHGFTVERPQQALLVVSPENGIVQRSAVFAD